MAKTLDAVQSHRLGSSGSKSARDILKKMTEIAR